MKLAAIDIGSNAIRFQVTHVMTYEGQHYFKRLEYVRFPLRLGQDVFKLKKIGEKSEDKFIRLMNAFKLLIDLYEVDQYYACATSAMREAANGREITKKVKELLGLKINIISGEREAELINRVVMEKLGKGTFLHVDVGGGSTEFTVFAEGRVIESKSFKLGTVRVLNDMMGESIWKDVKKWIEKHTKKYEKVSLIGSGGNINSIYKASGKKIGKPLSYFFLSDYYEKLKSYTYHERIYELQMNADRADVIIPATRIYLSAMKWSKSKNIYVPKIGLSDGIIKYLYNQKFKHTGL